MKGTRWLTSWPNSPLTIQMPTEWSGSLSDQVRKREFPVPRSLTNVKLGFSEKKWAEAEKRLDKTKNRKYRPSEKQKPDPTVARANKRLASRFYQLKAELTDKAVHCVDHSTPGCQLLVVPV